MTNWIQAKEIVSGKIVNVRQGDPGGAVFIDDTGNEVYTIHALDFNGVEEKAQKEMPEITMNEIELDPSAAKSFFQGLVQATSEEKDNRAFMQELGFWRELRVRMFANVVEQFDLNSEEALELTKEIVNRLYEQDKEFRNKYFNKKP